MKHLKRFNLITESNTNKECVDLIIDAMRDFLDDDRKILFKSPIDDMRYQDYIDKNSNYSGFKPIVNTGSLIRGQFTIQFQDIKDYSDFLYVSTNMQSVFGKLKDEDWTMYDMKLVTSAPPDNQGDVNFKSLSFHFSRPDERIKDEFTWPNESDVKNLFDKYGLVNLSFDYDDNETEVRVEFDSVSYDGRVTSSADDLFELVCNRFGFSSYNYQAGDYRVTFEV